MWAFHASRAGKVSGTTSKLEASSAVTYRGESFKTITASDNVNFTVDYSHTELQSPASH